MSIDLFSENKQTLQIHKRGVLILFLSDKRHFALRNGAYLREIVYMSKSFSTETRLELKS